MSVDELTDSSDGADVFGTVDVFEADGVFETLAQLARQCAARQRQQPIVDVPAQPRQAVLFRIGRYRLLVPIDGVAEILELPTTFAEVPGTCHWVVGIANHRGELLPLFDLRGLLLTAETGAFDAAPMEGRILVPRGCRAHLGLLVEEVIGMRTFHQLEQVRDEDFPGALGGIVRGFVGEGSGRLPMVDFTLVEALPAFRAAPVSDHHRP